MVKQSQNNNEKIRSEIKLVDKNSGVRHITPIPRETTNTELYNAVYEIDPSLADYAVTLGGSSIIFYAKDRSGTVVSMMFKASLSVNSRLRGSICRWASASSFSSRSLMIFGIMAPFVNAFT